MDLEAKAKAEAVRWSPAGRSSSLATRREGIRRPTACSPLLARYTTSGALDPAFGVGLVGSRPESQGGIVYHDVAVRSDGSIIAVGGRNEHFRGVGPPAGVIDAYRPDAALFGEYRPWYRAPFESASSHALTQPD